MKLLIDLPDICGWNYPNCLKNEEKKHTADFICVIDALDNSGNPIAHQINLNIQIEKDKYSKENSRVFNFDTDFLKNKDD